MIIYVSSQVKRVMGRKVLKENNRKPKGLYSSLINSLYVWLKQMNHWEISPSYNNGLFFKHERRYSTPLVHSKGSLEITQCPIPDAVPVMCGILWAHWTTAGALVQCYTSCNKDETIGMSAIEAWRAAAADSYSGEEIVARWWHDAWPSHFCIQEKIPTKKTKTEQKN